MADDVDRLPIGTEVNNMPESSVTHDTIRADRVMVKKGLKELLQEEEALKKASEREMTLSAALDVELHELHESLTYELQNPIAAADLTALQAALS